jgi:indolepyruvate ferredoxin oxidoreductase alpha subunit
MFASDVVLGEKLNIERKAHFERDIVKYTKAGAAWCMAQHQDTLNRLTEASKIADNYISESGIKINETHIEPGSKCGVIYAGAVQGNFQEVLKKYNLKLSWLKIGMIHPLPEERIKKFLKNMDRVLVLEELDPLIEAEVMRLAFLLNKKIDILGKFDKTLSLIGNYSFKKIKKGFKWAGIKKPVIATIGDSTLFF